MADVASSSDGVSIAYETHGAGEPALIFVHGWSCDRTYWRNQLEHFAARHVVVAVDLGGHGESGSAREDWTMPAFGEDVVAVIEQLGLERVVLVGHSMGGDVIVETALRLPGRIVGLVWVDVYGSLGESLTREQLAAFVAPFQEDFAGTTRDFVRRMFPPGADPELVDWVANDMASAPPEVAVSALQNARGNDGPILTRLRELDGPLVAINPISAETDVESLRRYGIEAVLMPDVGHFAMLEQPARFNRLLDETVDAFAA